MIPYQSVGHSLDAGCHQFNVPHRGFLYRVIVEQVEGVLGTFTVNVYSSSLGCDENSSSSGQTAAARALYKVIPTQEGSGRIEFFSERGGDPYVNADGTLSVPERFLYLEIVPDDLNDNKRWDAILVVTDTGL